MMRKLGLFLALGGVMALSACDPNASVDPEQRAYHKANREAYLYQGI